MECLSVIKLRFVTIFDRLKYHVKAYIESLKSNILHQCGQPIGVCPSVLEWIDSSKKSAPASYTELYPRYQITRTPPIIIDPTVHWQFKLDYGGYSDPAFIANIPNGRFWENCAVISPDGRLLGDVSIFYKIDPRKEPSKHPAFWKKFQEPRFIDSSVGVASAPGGNSYFHWIFDVLPRIHLIQKSNRRVDKIIVNSFKHPFQSQSLALLGISPDQLIDGTENPHILAKELLVPSFPRHQTCRIGKWVFEFIRNTFIDQTLDSHLEKGKKIYISRSNANRRRLLNEKEVIDFLKTRGFECIHLESLTFKEQVHLLASSEYVIAPHGAGLTNIVFCPPGTKIIEIFSPNYVSVSYWNISAQVGLNYCSLFGEGERPPDFSEPHALKEDISVGLSKLEVAMETLENNKLVS